MHPPGVEPGPIAWKAIILPLDQECLMKKWVVMKNINMTKNRFLGGKRPQKNTIPRNHSGNNLGREAMKLKRN